MKVAGKVEGVGVAWAYTVTVTVVGWQKGTLLVVGKAEWTVVAATASGNEEVTGLGTKLLEMVGSGSGKVVA